MREHLDKIAALIFVVAAIGIPINRPFAYILLAAAAERWNTHRWRAMAARWIDRCKRVVITAPR